VLECFSYRNCNLCVRFIFSWRTTFSKRRLRLMIFWLCVILVILDFIRLNFESFVEKYCLNVENNNVSTRPSYCSL